MKAMKYIPKGSFVSMLRKTISLLENGEILNNGVQYSQITIRSYKQVYNLMRKWNFNFNAEAYDLTSAMTRKERLKSKRLMQKNVNSYLNLLIEKGYHPNTRKAHLKIIRTTLKKMEEHEGYLFPSLEYIRERKSNVIAMSVEEVELLHTTPPTLNGEIREDLLDAWYYTRLMIYSCMRVSDLVGFQGNFSSEFVTIITKKGSGSLSTFYLPEDVRNYLRDREGLSITPRVFRGQLKLLLSSYPEFCMTKVVYGYDPHGNPKTETRFLWELYTPHKLRSSGITYHLSKGLSEMEVRKISGHANGSEAFYRYVALSDRRSLELQKKNAELLTKSE